MRTKTHASHALVFVLALSSACADGAIDDPADLSPADPGATVFCDVPDSADAGGRFAFHPGMPKWSGSVVRYRIVNTPGGVDAGAAKSAVRAAFYTWSQYIPVVFIESAPVGATDISLSWAGASQNNNAFDGPGGVAARSTAPPASGTGTAFVTFDISERWAVGATAAAQNLDIETIALHEIGHAIGLQHSIDQSVMKWSVRPGENTRDLFDDDVRGIQTLYGARFHFYDQGGTMASEPSLARNQDGRLELFARFTDGIVRQKWQTTANGGWSAWYNTSFAATSAPALFKNLDGRLQVFARGNDGALWTSAQTSAGGGWTSWWSLGGSITGDPAVQQQDDGRLIVFARDAVGDANNRWGIAYVQQTSAGSSAWTAWSTIPIGTPTLARPVSIRNDDGRLEVLVVGYDTHAYTAWQNARNGGFTAFYTLGGPELNYDYPLAAARNPDGRLEVFGLSRTGDIWSVAQGSPGCCWSWQQLSQSGGFGAPAAGLQLDGNIMVVARGAGDRAWRLAKAGPVSWPALSTWKSGWWPADGRMAWGSTAAIARNADGRGEIFLRGWSGELLHGWQGPDGKFY